MKIQFSALVSATSGKLNGSVASHNKGGAYFRNKGIVTNPDTSGQQDQRSRFGSMSQIWRTLTDAQREAWIAAAPNFPFQDRLQQTRYLSGSSLFVKLNTVLVKYGEAVIIVPPVQSTFPVISLPVLNAVRDLTPVDPTQPMVFTGTSFDFVTDADFSDNYIAVTEMTAGLSPGISSPGTKYRTSLTWTPVPVGTSGTLDIGAAVQDAYNTAYGAQPVGSKIFMKVYMIDLNTGLKGAPISTYDIVTSIP